jgi:hypothetical protein
MCVRKTPLAEVFHFFPGNGARKLDVLFYGAKLTEENVVDVGVSFPGNGARKLDGGVVMMKPENLLACSK